MATPLLATKLHFPPVRPNSSTGPVIDQAALHGFLKKVRDFGMPLLLVNLAKPGQADGSDVKQ
jgi:hypothetical protein